MLTLCWKWIFMCDRLDFPNHIFLDAIGHSRWLCKIVWLLKLHSCFLFNMCICHSFFECTFNLTEIFRRKHFDYKFLKPQDSLGEFKIFCFLIFRKCRKSLQYIIRPSCNCFEWHIVMQYCPVANYHYVHNLWQSVQGTPNIYIFWLFPENWSISERTVNRAVI